MLRSTKDPAGMVTFPVAVQLFGATVQLRVVLPMLPGVPCRRVTVSESPCGEKTASLDAVHPEGSQVRRLFISVALAPLLLTE